MERGIFGTSIRFIVTNIQRFLFFYLQFETTLLKDSLVLMLSHNILFTEAGEGSCLVETELTSWRMIMRSYFYFAASQVATGEHFYSLLRVLQSWEFLVVLLRLDLNKTTNLLQSLQLSGGRLSIITILIPLTVYKLTEDFATSSLFQVILISDET